MRRALMGLTLVGLFALTSVAYAPPLPDLMIDTVNVGTTSALVHVKNNSISPAGACLLRLTAFSSVNGQYLGTGWAHVPQLAGGGSAWVEIQTSPVVTLKPGRRLTFTVDATGIVSESVESNNNYWVSN